MKKSAIVKTAHPDFKLEDVFPWSAQLSAGIDKDAFLKSFFVQPDLYIRMAKGMEAAG
jgi:16S rRNA (cytosine967-C5)-methyltransferase